MVKYLKAWKDYKNIDIKGMAITILVCNNFSVTENGMIYLYWTLLRILLIL